MATIKHEADSSVAEAIEEATRAACEVLDRQFPGFENGGITSNFQGMLRDVIGHMLKGKSVLDAERGHSSTLPKLVVDNAFFGDPRCRGTMFLVTKPGDAQAAAREALSKVRERAFGETQHDHDNGGVPELLALAPDSLVFRGLDRIGDAWTSFDAAATFALNYLRAEGLSIAEAAEMGLMIQAVEFDPAKDRGFVLAGQAAALAV